MYFKHGDKLWVIVNTADYLIELLVDTMLYELYTKEVTFAYTKNKISNIKEFEIAVDRFVSDHLDDYQVADIQDITTGVVNMILELES